MGLNIFFNKLHNRLRTPELFARPSKLIIGKWQLFEYFIDADNELVHVQESQLRQEKQMLVISLLDGGDFLIANSLQVPVILRLKEGKWSVSKNFVAFNHPPADNNKLEFQFAFEKGKLKLLKKGPAGNIEFFGFFKRIVEK